VAAPLDASPGLPSPSLISSSAGHLLPDDANSGHLILRRFIMALYGDFFLFELMTLRVQLLPANSGSNDSIQR
jgi:hypothetical protein